ncbi:hypothetical protein KM043_010797 [Ampulex compressa]|nr:hypothetical protein KM043_010797 [Ampulex compressa]
MIIFAAGDKKNQEVSFSQLHHFPGVHFVQRDGAWRDVSRPRSKIRRRGWNPSQSCNPKWKWKRFAYYRKDGRNAKPRIKWRLAICEGSCLGVFRLTRQKIKRPAMPITGLCQIS